MKTDKSSAFTSQSGFTLPLFALLIAVFLMIASLVVDHSKEEIAVQNIQRTADAAALAAARQLNGRVDGWWNAKKAAVLALKNNPIHGASIESSRDLKLTSGTSAFWDDPQNLPATIRPNPEIGRTPPSEHYGLTGKSGHLTVTVERGLYWAGEDGAFKFLPLEADEDGLKGASPLFIMANAVRVRVELDQLDTFFGGIFGATVFENLRREAIAVMDSTLERPVAPIGIPLCQLLFNTNPNVTAGQHVTEEYNGALQCERSTYVAEMNAKGDLATSLDLGTSEQNPLVITAAERIDGMTRAESFERPPYFFGYRDDKQNLCFSDPVPGGAAQNCKALPIYATLGVPGAPGETANAEEVVAALTAGGAPASVGGFFKPLPTLQGMTDDGVRQRIADAINASPTTFRSVFFNGDVPKRNYPFLRTLHINPPNDPQGRSWIGGDAPELYDRNLTMPAPPGLFGNDNQLKFLMHDMANLPGTVATNPQLNYTNPMCHDDRIYHNAPDQAKVMEVYAMVLAPGIERYNGDLVHYCDFQNVFSYSENLGSFRSREQQAVAPIEQSQPTIVGFVKVNIFDLNFQVLKTRPAGVTDPRIPQTPIGYDRDERNLPIVQDANTPIYLNGNGALWDGNPYGFNLAGNAVYNDIYNNTNKFQDEYKVYADCENSNAIGKNCGSEPKTDDRRFFIPDSLRECFDFSKYDALYEAMKSISPGGDWQTTIQNFASLLNAPIRALPGRHCLPRLRENHYDKNDPDAYEELRDLDAGVGCGALRVKIDCGTKNTVIPTAKDSDRNNPTLISSS